MSKEEPSTSGPGAFSRLEREGWQRVAGKYEDAWSGLTRLFIPPLLQAAGVKPGSRLLDVACGPGYAAEAALALGAEPMGVDFSAEMIRLARERAPRIEFRVGDAQALDFEDNSFHAVVMNFGVLHLPNPEAAFAEARRVLRRDGRYAFTVWAGPDKCPGVRIIEEAIKAHADMNVEVPQGPDYLCYGDPAECREALGRAGFDPATLVFRAVTAEWQVPTASFIFESDRDAGVRTAALLAAQRPETLTAIQSRVEDSVRALARGDGFAIPYAAHLVAVTSG